MSPWSRVAWFVTGALTGVLVLLGLVAWNYHLYLRWPPSKDSRTVGPVAVSPRWSVTLEEKTTHPFLAEYDYRLRVFRSDGRDGEYVGTVELIPNSGGRTSLCLYTRTAADHEPLLEVADRMETSFVDLHYQRRLASAPNGYERHYVGAFVEEAAPLRFVSAQIDPTCPSNR